MHSSIISIVSFMILVAGTASSYGQQMRIETEVFMGEHHELASRSLTLFDGPFIYDYLFTSNPNNGNSKAVFELEEIVVFDRVGQTISLLDQTRQTKLVISHTDLLSMSAAMKASESLRKKDLFLLEPAFNEDVNDQQTSLSLSSQRLNYKCQCESIDDPKLLLSYFHFADWAARLNVSDSRKMPPFARLKLNDSLRRKGWIPKQVDLQLKFQTGEFLLATAKHNRLLQLSENDQIRIRQAQRQMNEYTETSLIEYRNLAPVSAN